MRNDGDFVTEEDEFMDGGEDGGFLLRPMLACLLACAWEDAGLVSLTDEVFRVGGAINAAIGWILDDISCLLVYFLGFAVISEAAVAAQHSLRQGLHQGIRYPNFPFLVILGLHRFPQVCIHGCGIEFEFGSSTVGDLFSPV